MIEFQYIFNQPVLSADNKFDFPDPMLGDVFNLVSFIKRS